MDKPNHENAGESEFGFTPEDLEEFRREAEAEMGMTLFCLICETVHPFGLCPADNWPAPPNAEDEP